MGIGFSIPSHMVQHVIDQIMNGGCVKRAYLGIILQPIDQALADALGLEKTDGVLVSDVIKDSPAAKNGLQQGDIILQYNDKTVKSVAKFRNDIALMNPGDEVRLKVMRQNHPVDLKIALGLQNDQEVLSSEIMQKIGIDVENLSMELAAKLGLPVRRLRHCDHESASQLIRCGVRFEAGLSRDGRSHARQRTEAGEKYRRV